MNIVDRVTSKGIQYEISDSRAREEKLDRSELPDKLSAFKNDLGLIDRTITDLQNFYNKSETYSKAEIDQKLALKLHVYIVDELPTEEIDRSAIYFIPRATAEASASDAYDEYIWAGDWELIGNTHVDLSNYYTKAEADLKTAGKIAEETAARASADTAINAEISALKTEDESLDGKITTEKNRAEYAELQLQNAIGNSDSSIAAETMRAQTAENRLSDRLDSVEPHLLDTENPHSVTAEQVGLGNVANVGTDTSPTMNSRNNVESGGVFSALESKVDKVSGKGLSDQNFTYEEKTKLSNLSNYDDTELDSRVTATESAITTLNGDSSVSGSVDKKIADAMSGITGFDFSIVSSLPASGEKGIIYLTPQPTQGEQDSYDEYIWLDSAWEYLGKKSVTVDLTNYYKKNQVNALLSGKNDRITVADDSSALTDDDSFDETPAGTNQATVKRRRLPLLWAYIKNKFETYFSIFFHDDDLRIFNEDGDIEIGEPNDENAHVTHINNDCNMEHELTVNGDVGVGGSIGIEGDMSVEGEINQIGTLADLTTDAKTNLVNALNEVNAKFGGDTMIFINSESAWNELDAETKATYQVAILTDQPTVNAVDSTDGTTTVVANKNLVFKGTLNEWEALTTAEKKAYDEALITNDMDTGEVVDTVTDGDMRAVTSNAVYDAMNSGLPNIIRFVKTYNNVSIPSTGYVILDSMTSFPSDYHAYTLIGIVILGAEYTFSKPLSIIRGSDTTTIYALGAEQTVSSISIGYILCNNVTDVA